MVERVDSDDNRDAPIRDVTLEYQGQIVDATIIRSFGPLHRVVILVKGGYYRLAWVRRSKVLNVD